MKLHLLRRRMSSMQQLLPVSKKIFTASALSFLMMHPSQSIAQGTWTKIATTAPNPNLGVMLLLSDGTVICKSSGGGVDGYGTIWNRLKPDSKGSYVNGTWSSINPMKNSRLYFSSQVLKDGKVYVCGGEYGTGGSAGEVYDPQTNTWTLTPAPGAFVSDANSEILEDGRVLQAIVQGNPFIRQTKLYTPSTNTYAAAPSCIGAHNESTWVKLPDNSILMVDRNSRNSERYILSLNQWVADATVPVDLYDPFGLETGAGLLLPDGRAFFIGSLGHTAYYKPTGNNNPGTWTAGPDIPNGNGQADAPAAMMVNGRILLTAAPKPISGNVFRSPTTFYVFDYTTNVYTQINSPEGGQSINIPVYQTNMLDLPDGTVLFSRQNSSDYYVFKPTGKPIAQAKPVISSVTKNTTGNAYTIKGSLFNGISEGACYGDDWQMATNYPIVRLRDNSNNNIYYCTTSNWNSTGVRRVGLNDDAQFTLPAGLPVKQYDLFVVANGIASTAFPFTPTAAQSSPVANAASVQTVKNAGISPNPATGFTTLRFTTSASTQASIRIFDLNGTEVKTILNGNISAGDQTIKISTAGLAAGNYVVRIVTSTSSDNIKLMVQ